ncbi:hypothetical protein [Microbulbifer sp. TRSA007]|uniref:hypothetical protein n=1 Tax=Microbulbifer sp. TRSA007 TaxID=3243384 RepID=UPI00403A32D8
MKSYETIKPGRALVIAFVVITGHIKRARKRSVIKSRRSGADRDFEWEKDAMCDYNPDGKPGTSVI